MPISECLKRFTYKDFILTLAYLDREWNSRTKLDSYLAAIRVELMRARAKEPDKVTDDMGFIKFVSAKEADKNKLNKYGPIYRADGSEIIVTKELIDQVYLKERKEAVRKGMK